MNNLQYIIENNTRAAMHMAVELCEQGDFDSVTEAFRWLMQERGSDTQEKGTLTAEQIRETVEKHWHDLPDEYDMPEAMALPEYSYDWHAIADELNAAMGGGTCKITATSTNNLMYPDYMVKWYELSCGHSLTLKGDEAPKWCAVCGKAVER